VQEPEIEVPGRRGSEGSRAARAAAAVAARQIHARIGSTAVAAREGRSTVVVDGVDLLGCGEACRRELSRDRYCGVRRGGAARRGKAEERDVELALIRVEADAATARLASQPALPRRHGGGDLAVRV